MNSGSGPALAGVGSDVAELGAGLAGANPEATGGGRALPLQSIQALKTGPKALWASLVNEAQCRSPRFDLSFATLAIPN